VVDRFLRKHGLHVEVVHEFDNIENIKKAIEIGAGVALLPEPTLRREVGVGTLVAVPLEGARLTRPLGVIHRKLSLSAAARRFIDLLCEEQAGRAATRAGLNGHAGSQARTNGTARGPRKKV
jgi:DNA-binding transcriptional LysR family regulator